MKRIAIAALGLLLGCGAGAAEPDDSYTVDVWADVLFDTEGRAQRIDLSAPHDQPDGFVERVKGLLAAARVPPPRDDSGAAATLQSGVHVWLKVTRSDGAASARITGLEVGPRVLKRYAASMPQGVSAGGVYDARVRCVVTVRGRCRDIVVDYTTLVNDSMRRWAAASAAGYEFAPQRLNGQPIEAEVTLPMRLMVDDSMPQEFRHYRH